LAGIANSINDLTFARFTQHRLGLPIPTG